LDRPSIFSQAIEDHLAGIASLRDQQSVLERIAEGMTQAVLDGKKSSLGRKWGVVPPILNHWSVS
jgi:hypothetical protein